MEPAHRTPRRSRPSLLLAGAIRLLHSLLHSRQAIAVAVGALLLLGVIGAVLAAIGPAALFAPQDTIDLAALYHNTHETFYRSVRGAVPTGQPVTLRLRAAKGNLSAVELDAWVPAPDGSILGETAYDAVRSTVKYPADTSDTYEYWEVTLSAQKVPHQWRYKWLVTSRGGAQHAVYEDHFSQIAVACEPTGGAGVIFPSEDPNCGFALNIYVSGFDVPDWVKHAVIYQIFVDRFYNAVAANDALVQPLRYDTSCAGPDGKPTPQGYYLHPNWSDEPLTPPQNCDFFGGDLQGVQDKLDYLHGLGVTALYLNPIFMADSNHKYDTVDYLMIDPHFGNLATWRALVAKAHSLGMHIILDGVFNHTSSDSIYFDRYGAWHTNGADESQRSRYRQWYTFTTWPQYSGWFGVDSLPQLAENPGTQNFIFAGDPAFLADAGDTVIRAQYGEEPLTIPTVQTGGSTVAANSVAKYWLAQGAGAWRLDASEQKSEFWWQQFRASIKAMDPDAIMIGEYWGDASEYVLGDQMDGTMNYRFRRAALSFFDHGGIDPDSGHDNDAPATATQFDAELQSVLEEYPLPAVYASMNLVDSHDTGRILWELGDSPGASPDQIAQAKQTLRLIVQFQMTWIGAPTIYYGDEAGQTQTTYRNTKVDPGDRRAFPWDAQDTTLEDWYRQWISVRNAHPVLATGAEQTLLTDDQNALYAYQRTDGHETAVVALNADGPDKAHSVTFTLPGAADGAVFTDAATHETLSVHHHQLTVTLQGLSGRVLFTSGA
jgi:cyclomaltodextrinase